MAASETRVTRGRLLKRAGVGAAALGAGTMITASTAGASLPASAVCKDPAGANGCGTCPGLTDHPCPGGSGCCFCGINTESCCVCVENFFCNTPACTSSSQCPPGWSCLPDTCCGAGGVCAPHCGAVTHHNVCAAAQPQFRAAKQAGQR